MKNTVFPFSELICLIALASCGPADFPTPLPSWQARTIGREASIRGLSAVNERVAWLSGSESTVARTTDGGASWEILAPPSTDTLDFRDIEAFDDQRAVLMSAGPGALSRVYRTQDGGRSWEQTLQNELATGFFNGIAFWNETAGVLTGDPVDGTLFIAVTTDAGASWQRIPPENIPPVDSLEYGFAASGTHIAAAGDSLAWIGTGGLNARVFHTTDRGKTWKAYETPMISGKASAGIFSLAFLNKDQGVAVGGDYAEEKRILNNISTTADGGRSWQLVDGHQVAYRSCVRAVNDRFIVAGPTGTDISYDLGRSWRRIDSTGYHVISVGNSPRAVWAAGTGGRVAKLLWEPANR